MSFKNFRIGIITIIIMLIIDISIVSILPYELGNSTNTHFLGNSFRFGEKVDRTVFSCFLDYIRIQDGYKIVFIGDSVVAGATVKDNNSTIPTFFEGLATNAFPSKNIKVFNLAMPGNRPADVYFCLKRINEEKICDLVIMNMNYAFYSDEMLATTPIARQELYEDVMEKDSAKILGLTFNPTENIIKNNVINKWTLYDKRDTISFILFGTSLRERLSNPKNIFSVNPISKSPVNPDSNPDIPWYEQTFANDRLVHWVEAFNIDSMDSSNKGYFFLEKTSDYVKSKNVKAVGFFTPINSGLVKKFDLMKHGKNFNKNINKMENTLKESNMQVFDYTNLIDEKNFNDLFHLLSSGNQLLANKLFDDVKSLLEKEANQ